jgi:hypothetical protein
MAIVSGVVMTHVPGSATLAQGASSENEAPRRRRHSLGRCRRTDDFVIRFASGRRPYPDKDFERIAGAAWATVYNRIDSRPIVAWPAL